MSTNEILGKEMFSQVLVCPPGGERVCLQGGGSASRRIYIGGAGSASGGSELGCVCIQGGVCIWGRLHPGRLWADTPPRTRKTGGTHPTGMLSPPLPPPHKKKEIQLDMNKVHNTGIFFRRVLRSNYAVEMLSAKAVDFC